MRFEGPKLGMLQCGLTSVAAAAPAPVTATPVAPAVCAAHPICNTG